MRYKEAFMDAEDALRYAFLAESIQLRPQPGYEWRSRGTNAGETTPRDLIADGIPLMRHLLERMSPDETAVVAAIYTRPVDAQLEQRQIACVQHLGRVLARRLHGNRHVYSDMVREYCGLRTHRSPQGWISHTGTARRTMMRRRRAAKDFLQALYDRALDRANLALAELGRAA